MINQEKSNKGKKVQNQGKHKNPKKNENQSNKGAVENELKNVNKNVQEDLKSVERQINDLQNLTVNNPQNNPVEQIPIGNNTTDKKGDIKTDVVNIEKSAPVDNTAKVQTEIVSELSTKQTLNAGHKKPEGQSQYEFFSDTIEKSKLEMTEGNDTNNRKNEANTQSINDSATVENNSDLKDKVDDEHITTLSNTQSSQNVSKDASSDIANAPEDMEINRNDDTTNENKENDADHGKQGSIESKKRKDKGKKNQQKKTEAITAIEKNTRSVNDENKQVPLKFLNGITNTEEKLKIICKKYSDLHQENCILQSLTREHEKKSQILQKEKEILQIDNNRHVITREKLENLCRELQKQNKAIKEESLKRICEEEEKRKEVSMKFKNTLNEISTLMQESSDKNVKLRDDNLDITKKFKQVVEQYEIREQELLEYKTQCAEMQKTEISLRNQISMYSEKYDEFQQTLSRSNEIFAGFKSEMEKMSSKITNLEKETLSWKQRWERSHEALLEMATDKQKSDQELATTARQLAALLKLCRTLQSERIQILAQINRTGNSENNSQQPNEEEFSKTDDTLRQITSLFHKNIENPPPEQEGNIDKLLTSETSTTPKNTKKDKKSARNKQ